MKLVIFTIKDTLTNEAEQIFTMPKEEVAIREIEQIVKDNNQENQLVKFKQDKELWRIGYYDTESMKIENSTKKLLELKNIKAVK